MSIHEQVKEITEQILQKQDTIHDLQQSSKSIQKRINELHVEILDLQQKRKEIMFSQFEKGERVE